MELLVDIRKKLPGFELDVKLEGSDETIGLLGASGSGKSMTLRCMAGLVTPDEGIIVVNGRTFFDSKRGIDLKPRERNVGLLFQNYALFPHLTVWENIAFGLSRIPKMKSKAMVSELMESFHLNGLEMRYPSQISGGQQQRAALARVMAAQPGIILLDEPFSALDVHLRSEMLEEMKERLFEFGKGAIFVTHNIEEAFSICDKLAVLSRGKVHVCGEKSDVLASPQTLEVMRITGCENIAQARLDGDGFVDIKSWNLRLKTDCCAGAGEGHAGIRASHIMLCDDSSGSGGQGNTAQAWIAGFSETPLGIKVYLRFSMDSGCSHLAWAVGRETWEKIRLAPQPIVVRIPQDKVMFVKNAI